CRPVLPHFPRVRAPPCCSLTATASPVLYTLSLHDALPIFTGRTRQPPQCGGTGISSTSANLRSTAARWLSRASLLPTLVDCGEAHAPSCDPRGRPRQYSAVSSALTFSTSPRTVT